MKPARRSMDQVDVGYARALLGMLLLGAVAGAAPAAAQEPETLAILASFDPEPNPSGWADGPVDVSFSCNVPCEITVTIADAPYEDSFTLSEDGEHFLSVTASADGYESVSDDLFLGIDSVAPTATLDDACDTPGEGVWCLDEVALYAGHAEDDGSDVTLTCTLDGDEDFCFTLCRGEGQEIEFSLPCPRMLREDGVYDFAVTATDLAGNGDTVSTTVHIDGAAPVPASVSCSTDWQTHQGWCAALLDITPASDETSGIAFSECRVGADVVPCDIEGTLDATGEIYFFANATDEAGNEVTDDIGVGWYVDPDAPVTSIDATCGRDAPNEGWCLESVAYTMGADDALSGIASILCFVDDVEAACEGTLETAGMHTLSVKATDVAGGMAEDSLDVGLDLSPPTASIAFLCDALDEGTGWCTDGASVDLEASDEESDVETSCWIDEDEEGDCPPQLVDGEHTLHLRVTDEAGRTITTSDDYMLDTSAPEIAIEITCDATPIVEGVCPLGFSYEVTASDAGIGLDGSPACTVDDVEAACSGSVSSAGVHAIAASVADLAGRSATASAEVVVDIARPVASVPGSVPNGRVLPGQDDGRTRATFYFSKPMDTVATLAAITGAPGWAATWNATNAALNLTPPASAEEGSYADIAVGTGARDTNGVPLLASVSQRIQVRGGPDYEVAVIPNAFVDISENGTDAGMYCDDTCYNDEFEDGTTFCGEKDICGTDIELPFGFTYSGRTFYELNISPNGFITFGNANCLSVYIPRALDTACANTIAPYWTDLDTRPFFNGAPDRIRYATIGEEPHRAFVVSWDVVHHYSHDPPIVTFQLQLMEGTNVLEFHYEDARTDHHNHLIGLVNGNRSRSITYAYTPNGNTHRLDMVDTALRFSGPGTLGDTTAPTVEVTGDEGLLATAGATITYTFSEPMDETETLAALEGAEGWSASWSEDSTVLTITREELAEGEHVVTLTSRAADLNGVRIAHDVSRTLIVDTIAPTVELSLLQEGADALLVLTFSEPMDPASVEAALFGVDGWSMLWDETSTQLALATDDVDFGTTEVGVGPGATDAHGVPLAEGAQAETSRPRPREDDDRLPLIITESPPPEEPPLVEEPVVEEPVPEDVPVEEPAPEVETPSAETPAGDEGDAEDDTPSTRGSGADRDDDRDDGDRADDEPVEVLDQDPLESSSIEEDAAPEPEIVFDVPVGAGARGVVTFRLTGIERIEEVSVVLLEGDRRIVLATGQEVVEWDTTTVPDGMHRILVIRTTPDPEPGELAVSAAEVELASRDVLVRNDFSAPAVAAGAAVAGVLAVAGAQAGASAMASGASSAMSSAGGGFDAFGFAQEVAGDVAEDKIRDKRGKRESEILERRRQMRSLVVAGISFALLAGLWAFSQMQAWTLAEWLRAVPVIGLAAVIVMGLKYASESALAHATGAKARVKLLISGTIALAFSSIVLRNPFGYPGYVDEVGESEARSTWRMQGLRALAVIAGAAAFMIPFLAIATVAPWGFVSVGVLLAVTNVATTAMPFGPLPGRDVWRWNKALAVAVAVAGLALYVGFAAALVPLWSLWTIGVAGGVAYATALVLFRRGSKGKTVRVPVQVPVAVEQPRSPEKKLEN